MEEAVAAQLVQYMDDNLSEKLQSASKRQRGTAANRASESACYDDILRAAHNGRTVVLLLLYLSAAFDTADHSLLLPSSSFCFRYETPTKHPLTE